MEAKVVILRSYLLALFFPLLLIVTSTPTYASAYSIPVVGRWSTLQVGFEIPSTPIWAHDLVLNASRVWNLAQAWFKDKYVPDGSVYEFVERPGGNATVSFGIPRQFASIAVGWTQYILDKGSIIIGARVFLDGNVFNAGQEHNATARDFGFRLALHELGRALGLGSLVDGLDIMDPIGSTSHANDPPIISTIDLFALHVLASEPFFSSPLIVLNTDQTVSMNAWNVLGLSPSNQTAKGIGDSAVTCPHSTAKFPVCYS